MIKQQQPIAKHIVTRAVKVNYSQGNREDLLKKIFPQKKGTYDREDLEGKCFNHCAVWIESKCPTSDREFKDIIMQQDDFSPPNKPKI